MAGARLLTRRLLDSPTGSTPRRAADGYPAPSSISLSWSIGPRRTQVAVMGNVIGRLDPSSRRSLACLLAEEPRRLPLRQRPHRGSVDAYLATAGEPNLIVGVSGGRRGTGVVARDGSVWRALAAECPSAHQPASMRGAMTARRTGFWGFWPTIAPWVARTSANYRTLMPIEQSDAQSAACLDRPWL